MSAADFTAAIPEPYRILGIRLLPLSIGRYRLLKRFHCAFVAEETISATIGDLILGVLISSMRCDEFLAFYESDKCFRDIRRWSNRIGANPPWYLRGKLGRILSATFIGKQWRKNHSFNFIEKMKLFQTYIEESQQIPEFHILQNSAARSSAHWSTNIEIVLRSELGWSVEEINEAPLSKALSDYFKHLENQGLVAIITPEDLEIGKINAAAMERLEVVCGA